MSAQDMPSFVHEPKEALAFFHEHGYLIERGLWPPDERDKLVRASENLPSFKDGTCAPAMNPHNWDRVFFRALAYPPLLRILELILGGRVSGIQTEFFIGKPGTPGFAAHQDNYYVEAPRDAFVSVWSPMVDVSRTNGTLMIYPGSHHENILPIEPVEVIEDPGQDKNAHRQQVVLPDKYRPMDVIASAGDAVFIHGYLVHKSHKNLSNGYRRVLLSTYIRAGVTFRPGNTAKRTEVNLYS